MIAKIDRMAKPRKSNTESVRIDKEIARKARMVAAARDKSLPDYLNELLGSLVEKDLDEVMTKYNKGGCAPKPKKAAP